MRDRIAYYRRAPISSGENPQIGCIVLGEPFFWPREAWIPSPSDFKLNTVQGKGYDSEIGSGRMLWDAVVERLKGLRPAALEPGTAALAAVESNGFGKPQVVMPRLGQGLFRVLLTDAYGRRCSLTGERTLPVLEAAHIKPYSVVQRHEISNGLLMRSDLHRLFDEGYMTVDPTAAPCRRERAHPGGVRERKRLLQARRTASSGADPSVGEARARKPRVSCV